MDLQDSQLTLIVPAPCHLVALSANSQKTAVNRRVASSSLARGATSFNQLERVRAVLSADWGDLWVLTLKTGPAEGCDGLPLCFLPDVEKAQLGVAHRGEQVLW